MSETAVVYAVLWGLQSVEESVVMQVTRMLSECHGRLTEPSAARVRDIIAVMMPAKDEPFWKPWNNVIGQMVRLDMERSR